MPRRLLQLHISSSIERHITAGEAGMPHYFLAAFFEALSSTFFAAALVPAHSFPVPCSFSAQVRCCRHEQLLMREAADMMLRAYFFEGARR